MQDKYFHLSSVTSLLVSSIFLCMCVETCNGLVWLNICLCVSDYGVVFIHKKNVFLLYFFSINVFVRVCRYIYIKYVLFCVLSRVCVRVFVCLCELVIFLLIHLSPYFDFCKIPQQYLFSLMFVVCRYINAYLIEAKTIVSFSPFLFRLQRSFIACVRWRERERVSKYKGDG